jgi:hypothetical protein
MTPNVYAVLLKRFEAAGQPVDGYVFPSKSADGHLTGKCHEGSAGADFGELWRDSVCAYIARRACWAGLSGILVALLLAVLLFTRRHRLA